MIVIDDAGEVPEHAWGPIVDGVWRPEEHPQLAGFWRAVRYVPLSPDHLRIETDPTRELFDGATYTLGRCDTLNRGDL